MENEEGELKDWVHSNFEMVPTIAAVTLLNKFQNDARISEAQILDHLYKSIDELDQKVNKLEARVIAPNNYILAGNAYKADILVAAYDTTSQPKIFLGSLNRHAQKNAAGSFEKTYDNPVDNG